MSTHARVHGLILLDEARSDASEVRRLVEENVENSDFFEPPLDCTPTPEAADS